MNIGRLDILETITADDLQSIRRLGRAAAPLMEGVQELGIRAVDSLEDHEAISSILRWWSSDAETASRLRKIRIISHGLGSSLDPVKAIHDSRSAADLSSRAWARMMSPFENVVNIDLSTSSFIHPRVAQVMWSGDTFRGDPAISVAAGAALQSEREWKDVGRVLRAADGDPDHWLNPQLEMFREGLDPEDVLRGVASADMDGFYRELADTMRGWCPKLRRARFHHGHGEPLSSSAVGTSVLLRLDSAGRWAVVRHHLDPNFRARGGESEARLRSLHDQ